MGKLKISSPPGTAGILRMPSGCFTVDPSGKVITSTLPQSFPAAVVQKIARGVLTSFHNAHEMQMALTEMQVHYPAFKLTARELKGGAIIFLAPQSPSPTQTNA